jgi:hypothetical protein
MNSPTSVLNGDQLFLLTASGHDGTGYREGANIEINVDGTPSSNSVPAKITFSTTPEGNDGPIQRMTILNNGNVGIGTNSPEQILSVDCTTKTESFMMTEVQIMDISCNQMLPVMLPG